MDGLDKFEKQLAEDKARRGHDRRKDHDPKHQRHSQPLDREREDESLHRHHRSRDHDGEEGDGHRHKRSRRDKDNEDDKERRHRHRHRDHESRRHGDGSNAHEKRHIKTSDPKEDLTLPDEERTPESSKLSRDAWMTDPAAIEVDYIHRGKKREKTPPPPKEPEKKVYKNELNVRLHASQTNEDEDAKDAKGAVRHEVNYTFGDDGSQWRMTKLRAVYTQAQKTGRPIDEIGEERFGSLREFDDAREEEIEFDRRKRYGKDYVGKEKPSGDLYQERLQKAATKSNARDRQPSPELEQGTAIPDEPAATPVMDQTALNRLRAQLMKAKLKGSADVTELEKKYNQAMTTFTKQPKSDIVLGVMESRMLAGTRNEVKAVDTKRGRERGLVEANDEMTIEDMVREERRTRNAAGGEGLRLAERIAKDGKFDDDLEYMDENAEKLAKRVQRSEVSLKNQAIGEFQKINRILDKCQLCHHEDRGEPPVAPIISLATRVYLTLPTEPELGDGGGAVIVPMQHHANLLECDDDEWEEMRNFMKCLTRMYHDQGREVIFYENAAAPQRHMHAAMQAVPIPWDLGDTAPAFFREAILAADEEWSQHKKIIDTGAKARDGLGKLAFRRSIAKAAPYFHVWFTLDGGLGHIVEDSERWPRGDLFAREIIGGMLDCEPDVIKKQGRWKRDDSRVDGFGKRWRKFDWTRVLSDG